MHPARVTKCLKNEPFDALVKASNGLLKSHKEYFPADMPESIEQEATKGSEYDESRSEDESRCEDELHSEDESENFSDIDDQELDGYLHNEEQKHYKTIIWEKVNREYLKEQAAKKAAAAAAKKAFEANFENCSNDLLPAAELAASAAAAGTKSRMEIRKRRAQEANLRTAKSPAAATGQALTNKRLGNKVNFDRLNEIFGQLQDADNPSKPKKVRFDPPPDNDDNLQSKVEGKNDDEVGSADGYEDDGDLGEMYENALHTENMDGNYFPEYDHYNYNDGYNYNDDDY